MHWGPHKNNGNLITTITTLMCRLCLYLMLGMHNLIINSIIIIAIIIQNVMHYCMPHAHQ